MNNKTKTITTPLPATDNNAGVDESIPVDLRGINIGPATKQTIQKVPFDSRINTLENEIKSYEEAIKVRQTTLQTTQAEISELVQGLLIRKGGLEELKKLK